MGLVSLGLTPDWAAQLSPRRARELPGPLDVRSDQHPLQDFARDDDCLDVGGARAHHQAGDRVPEAVQARSPDVHDDDIGPLASGWRNSEARRSDGPVVGAGVRSRRPAGPVLEQDGSASGLAGPELGAVGVGAAFQVVPVARSTARHASRRRSATARGRGSMTPSWTPKWRPLCCASLSALITAESSALAARESHRRARVLLGHAPVDVELVVVEIRRSTAPVMFAIGFPSSPAGAWSVPVAE